MANLSNALAGVGEFVMAGQCFYNYGFKGFFAYPFKSILVCGFYGIAGGLAGNFIGKCAHMIVEESSLVGDTNNHHLSIE